MYEMLVALAVSDENLYQSYREAMMPILQRYDGGFSNDFRVSEVLKAEDKRINRVFTIHFPDAVKMDAFFTDKEYLAVKQQYFERSVASTHILAEYAR